MQTFCSRTPTMKLWSVDARSQAFMAHRAPRAVSGESACSTAAIAAETLNPSHIKGIEEAQGVRGKKQVRDNLLSLCGMEEKF